MPSLSDMPEIVFDPLPGEALSRFISENVVTVNHARTGISTWYPANFFLKNGRGEYLGGLLGYVWGSWLHVNFLWVAEHVRGQGYGTRLMQAAESFAREHGAFAATLETFTMQAPAFYARQGYTVIGRLEDYPPGQAKLFLSKRLDGSGLV